MENAINDCLLWQSNRASAVFKRDVKDFIVHEVLGWDFTGLGEHIFLYVEKTNCNTVWVAKQLAKFYGVPPRDIGYSGLKDRHAVTRQYFSIRLPGVKPGSYELPTHNEYRVISHTLHDKKLKRGNHAYNDFFITLHDVSGDTNLIDERLTFIRDNGCPNLFDSQRFGHDNLNQLQRWVRGDIEVRKRNDKSLLLSALRSALFNRQLAQRVANRSWNTIVARDVVLLDGSNSFFVADILDDTLIARAAEKDIHPAGILVGAEDDLPAIGNMNEGQLRTLMRREHLSTSYRPLRLWVKNLAWRIDSENCYVLSMRLPTGAYASGVVRQVFVC